MSTCEGPAGPLRFSGGPGDFESQFPANGFFTSTDYWFRAGDKVPVEFALDVAVTERLGFDVFRPTNIERNDDVFWWDEDFCERPCSYCDSYCDDNLVQFGEPDLVAPTRPELGYRTILVSTPDTSTLCPDLDVLEIDIAVTDDVEPRANIGFALYIAPTVEEVAALSAPTDHFSIDWWKDPAEPYTVILGESQGHVRKAGENPFISPDPICIAIAAFDRAGNLSERSETTCLDTNDENDPTVLWVDDSMYSTGCCNTADGAGPATALLVAVVALVLRGTGRARRRDTF